jgi:hypothetical protein
MLVAGQQMESVRLAQSKCARLPMRGPQAIADDLAYQFDGATEGTTSS